MKIYVWPSDVPGLDDLPRVIAGIREAGDEPECSWELVDHLARLFYERDGVKAVTTVREDVT